MQTPIQVSLVLLLLATSAGGGVYHVDQGNPEAGDENSGSEASPWKTIGEAAERLMPGDEVIIHGGVYRESVVPKRSGEGPERMITYSGAAGEDVVIKGSVVLDGWRKEGDLWKAPWPHSEGRFKGYQGSFRYRYEQVFVGGKLLFHAPSEAFLRAYSVDAAPLEQLLQTEAKALRLRRKDDAPELVAVITRFCDRGAFWVDYRSGEIALKLLDGTDPRGGAAEVSVSSRLFGGDGVKYVRLRHLSFLHCAQRHFQKGAVMADTGWVLEDLDVGYSAGRGVSLGKAAVVRRVSAHHHGALGFGGRAELVEDCETSDNNTKGGGWLTAENGGWKAVCADGMIVRRHRACRNFGPGIWLDIDNRDCLIDDCVAEDNTGSGIFIEISGRNGIRVAGNRCVRNGLAPFSPWGSAGIKLGESESCTVEGNICVGNKEGIAIRMQGPRRLKGLDRDPEGNRIEMSYHTRDHTIRNNILAFNRDWQLVFWGDNAFFGPHPSAGINKSEAKGKPILNPEELGLAIDHNVYFADEGQALICYGPTWRPKHVVFTDLTDWQAAHAFDQNSTQADPGFADWKNGDFRRATR